MKNEVYNKIKRPSLWLYFTEAPRAFFEYIRSYSFLKKHEFLKKGAHHPILVIPGFMSSGASTKPLRDLFKRNGYQVYDWGLGRNIGNLEDISRLFERIEVLYQKHNQKITVIGWSLGGVYGRVLAREKSEKIEQLITLCSPFAGINEPNNASWLFRLIQRDKHKVLEEKYLKDLPKPLPISTAAIYSKNDGIVPWEACMEQEENTLNRNIEVSGSHIGLGFNRDVLMILEELL